MLAAAVTFRDRGLASGEAQGVSDTGKVRSSHLGVSAPSRKRIDALNCTLLACIGQEACYSEGLSLIDTSIYIIKIGGEPRVGSPPILMIQKAC